MRFLGCLLLSIFLFSVSLLSGEHTAQMIGPVPLTSYGESAHMFENPPPIDSLWLVFAGIDYGGPFNSPQAYPNAKHITNVQVGSYYFPVVIWQMGVSWDEQCVFSYWDDFFKFWSLPDSFSTSIGNYTGRCGVCADNNGDLHFTWYQTGNPDDYEVFYTRATLDTLAGVIQYTVERPAVMLSATNGFSERFASIALHDDLVMVIWSYGLDDDGIAYNYSTDGGDTWLGPFMAYTHSMPGGWQLISVAPDPNTGDMWAAVGFDYTGNTNLDIVGFHWNFAAGDTWAHELVIEGAPPPNHFPQVTPSVVVDYNGIPHIIYQENCHVYTGTGGIYGFGGCGPTGTLFYTHRAGGYPWSTPDTIKLPRYEFCNYESGLPSAGIAADNTIYFTTTQPESATPETSAYLPFNVHYAEISPYTGALSYGGVVSVGDTTYNAIYGQTPQFVPNDGPGITWSQLVNEAVPSDVYYRHKDTLLAIKETKTASHPSPISLYQNYPNPAREKTMIRFTVPNNTNISLNIYDISGRLVKTLANGIPWAASSFVVWNGKNEEGKEVPGGVYFYTLRAGAYRETRKLLLIN